MRSVECSVPRCRTIASWCALSSNSGWSNATENVRTGVSVKPRTSATMPEESSPPLRRSEEHTSELQSLMRISYAVFCLKKKTKHSKQIHNNNQIHYYHNK